MTLTELLAHVLATVSASLLDAGRPFDPREAMIATGQATWDTCCGRLFVLPLRSFRAGAPFPQELTGDVPCSQYSAATDISVTWLRCVPVLDASGNAPSIAAQQAAYDVLMADHDAIWRALISDDMLEVSGYELERAGVSTNWLVASGGCIGLDARLTLGLPGTAWCVP